LFASSSPRLFVVGCPRIVDIRLYDDYIGVHSRVRRFLPFELSKCPVTNVLLPTAAPCCSKLRCACLGMRVDTTRQSCIVSREMKTSTFIHLRFTLLVAPWLCTHHNRQPQPASGHRQCRIQRPSAVVICFASFSSRGRLASPMTGVRKLGACHPLYNSKGSYVAPQ
jgi:hypothetical protein